MPFSSPLKRRVWGDHSRCSDDALGDGAEAAPDVGGGAKNFLLKRGGRGAHRASKKEGNAHPWGAEVVAICPLQSPRQDVLTKHLNGRWVGPRMTSGFGSPSRNWKAS